MFLVVCFSALVRLRNGRLFDLKRVSTRYTNIAKNSLGSVLRLFLCLHELVYFSFTVCLVAMAFLAVVQEFR